MILTTHLLISAPRKDEKLSFGAEIRICIVIINLKARLGRNHGLKEVKSLITIGVISLDH